MIYVSYLFFGLAIFFAVVGSFGTLLMPDVYTRLQASSLAGTTAVVSVLIGSIFWVELGPMTGRLLVIFLFFVISGPTSTHIIGRYAWRQEIIPWRRPARWGLLPGDRNPSNREDEAGNGSGEPFAGGSESDDD